MYLILHSDISHGEWVQLYKGSFWSNLSFFVFLRRLSVLNSTSLGWITTKVQRRRRLLIQLRRKHPIKPQWNIGRFRGEMTIAETTNTIGLKFNYPRHKKTFYALCKYNQTSKHSLKE